MTTNSRRLLFACFGALMLGAAILWLATSGSGRYRAQARVIVTPYTTAFFTRSFESSVVQAIPGVMELRVFPSYSARPTPTTPTITNGAAIDIIVVGLTSLEAQRIANEAAVTLCAIARKLYGGTADVVEMADRARPYSFSHDRLQPRVARLFKR